MGRSQFGPVDWTGVPGAHRSGDRAGVTHPIQDHGMFEPVDWTGVAGGDKVRGDRVVDGRLGGNTAGRGEEGVKERPSRKAGCGCDDGAGAHPGVGRASRSSAGKVTTTGFRPPRGDRSDDRVATSMENQIIPLPEDPSPGIPRCRVVLDGRIGGDSYTATDEDGGPTIVTMREYCDSTALKCTPTQEIEGLDSRPDRNGYMAAQAWASVPDSLETMYPASQNWPWDRVAPGMRWTYLKVAAYEDSDPECTNSLSLPDRFLIWLGAGSQTDGRYAYAVSPKLPYACYSLQGTGGITREIGDDGERDRYVRIRYWVGMMHFGSVFTTWGDGPEEGLGLEDILSWLRWDGSYVTNMAPEYDENSEEKALARARALRHNAYMSCHHEVRTKVAWTLSSDGGAASGHVCEGQDRVIVRECVSDCVSRAGSDGWVSSEHVADPTTPEVTASNEGDPCVAFLSSGTDEGYSYAYLYEDAVRCPPGPEDPDTRYDLSPNVLFWAGGHARSLLGAMVRAEVEIRLDPDEGRDDAEALAREGFACVFGEKVKVSVGQQYQPFGTTPGDVERAVTRACITAESLVKVSELRSLVYALADSYEAFYVFNHYDVDRIVEDEADFRDRWP